VSKRRGTTSRELTLLTRAFSTRKRNVFNLNEKRFQPRMKMALSSVFVAKSNVFHFERKTFSTGMKTVFNPG
jgi:hypothetical protein